MIVGGNIDGVTRVMTTAIALETSKGDLPLALALGLVLLGVVLLLNALIALLRDWRVQRDDVVAPAHDGAADRAAFGQPALRRQAGAARRDAQRRGRRAHRHRRRQRLGQEQPAACAARSRAIERRAARARRTGAAFCDAVPAAVHVAHVGPGERRARAAAAGHAAARTQPACAAGAAAGGLAVESQRNARVLSAGQQQRAALARAWALRPDVLLLDEPTASLDPTAKREVEHLIEQFAEQGTTLLMSSHNLGQVKRLASRVLYLEHGRLLADVATEAFFNGPLPEEAALFLKGELPWA
jgi:tungstate transport system ATP-binding protein